jgi:hypothetical protein
MSSLGTVWTVGIEDPNIGTIFRSVKYSKKTKK